MRAIPSTRLTRAVRDVSHFKRIPPTELSIPGDAEKFILVRPGNNNFRFIAKRPKKCGSVEVLTEYFINTLGMRIAGFNISRSQIGIFKDNPDPSELLFLSLIFHGKGQRLTHGVQLFSKFYSKDEIQEFELGKRERNLYTIENIKASLELMYPENWPELFGDFIEMCLFDAYIGNQDRHAANWGVIESIDYPATMEVKFAPVFDTARGLFWNTPEDRLSKFNDPAAFDGYIERCRPQIATSQDAKVRHFGLVKFTFATYPEYQARIRSFVEKLGHIEPARIPEKPPFSVGMCGLRRHLIGKCLKARIEMMQRAIF